jgi:Pyridoxamine 5'-phosphate oxidase like
MTTKTSPFDHVWEIAKKIKTCMLTTLPAKRMRSRPMHAIIDREAGCLWFITDHRGAKDEEIRAGGASALAAGLLLSAKASGGAGAEAPSHGRTPSDRRRARRPAPSGRMASVLSYPCQ